MRLPNTRAWLLNCLTSACALPYPDDVWPVLEGLGEERVGDAQDDIGGRWGSGGVLLELRVMDGEEWPVVSTELKGSYQAARDQEILIMILSISLFLNYSFPLQLT